MGSFNRFTRYIKELWKGFTRGDDDDLRRQAISVEKEFARLRARRSVNEKLREEMALHQARVAVYHVQQLHEKLIEAEKFVASFTANLRAAAKDIIEAEKDMRMESCKMLAQQTQQILRQESASEVLIDKSVLVLQSADQEKESGASGPKTSRVIEDKDIMFAAMRDDETVSDAVNASPGINKEDKRQNFSTTVDKD